MIGGSVGGDEVPVLLRRRDPASVPLPTYANPGDAGADLVSAIDVDVPAGGRVSVPTGVAIALPFGYAAFVLARSGPGGEQAHAVLASPACIDGSCREEIQVTLVNPDTTRAVRVPRGAPVARLVVQPVVTARFIEVEHLPGSARSAPAQGQEESW